jgi:apolipoprotein N-acyltransferase
LIFPTEGIWILAPLVPALLLVAVMGAGFWSGTVIGFHGGLAFYISHVEWLSLYLGPVPLIALAILQALIFAPAMGLTALLWARISARGGRLGWGWFPPLAALIWTAREIVAINFPYGGFPWSRLAMSQADSLLSAWVYWGGMTLLSFVIALVGSLFATLISLSRVRGRAKSRNQILVAGGAMVTTGAV